MIITHLPSLHLLGGHHDDPGVLLEHHPPEVADGVLQAALRGDVALLRLGAVALRVLLRLRRGACEKNRKRSVGVVTDHTKHDDTSTRSALSCSE